MSIRVHSWLIRHRSAVILSLTILLVFAIRIRLRDMPLERDEGEYAYAGQLILQGVPPYKEAYNMKLPGTYAAYAVIMAIFGQTPSGIHVGVAFVNATSILLLFLIGRKILDEPAGVVAAISYALLSTSQSVLGLAGHATHFIVLPALAGTLLLLRAREHALAQILNPEFHRREQRERRISNQESINPPVQLPRAGSTFVSFVTFCLNSYAVPLAGLLFGIAFLMKQHGIFFGIFGGLYLAFSHIYQPRSLRERKLQIPSSKSQKISNIQIPTAKDAGARDVPARSISERSAGPESYQGATASLRPLRAGTSRAPRYTAKLPPIDWPRLFKELALFSAGFVTPYLLTCLILWAAGVFPQFTFWTITYAQKYAVGLPSGIGNDAVRTAITSITGANILLWIIPWLGALMLAWEKRLANEHRFFLVALLLCSFGSISVGFYFRQHYFITLLPVLALLTGLAVSRAIRLVKHDRTIELFLAIPVFLLFGLGCLVSLAGNGPTWFAKSPTEVIEQTHTTTLFTECRKLADYIRNAEKTIGTRSTASPSSANVTDAVERVPTPDATSAYSAYSAVSKLPRAGSNIAVLGSEPQIYFYTHRRSATGYIYMYPLMETHPYATQMQRELITQIETNHPEYIIYVDYRLSWTARPESTRLVENWWQSYSTNLELLQTIPISAPADFTPNPDIDPASFRGNLLLYRARNR